MEGDSDPREFSCNLSRLLFVFRSWLYSVIIWLICFWRPDCKFPERGLEDFLSSILFVQLLHLILQRQSFVFLLWETWGVVVKCPDAILSEVNILYYDLAFFSFRRLIVISRREVLKTLYSIMFTVVEVDSRTILYHLKEINWIGTHWRGTRRRSLVEGVKSIINFCLWLSDSMFLLYICLSVLFFISILSI